MSGAAKTGIQHFPYRDLPLIRCAVPGGDTRIARVINGSNSKQMGGGIEMAENVLYRWTTLYDEILFIHKGSMLVRMADENGGDREIELRPGDIIWLPEGSELEYDFRGRHCEYFYALHPFDWAERHGMQEP